MKEKEEYVKPLIAVYCMDPEEVLDQFKLSPREGDEKLSKPFNFDDEEEDEPSNKWDNLVPSGVPESWQPVGE